MKSKNAQTTVEFNVILSFVIIVLLLYFVFFQDISDNLIFNNQEKDNLYWENSRIAIRGIYLYDNQTIVTLKNNLRQTISLDQIYLDNQSLRITTDTIESGYIANFVSSKVIDDHKLHIYIVYTLNSSGESFNFDGNGVEYYAKIIE